MNDEEFARSVFARAFESGTTGEPPTLPSVERIAARGRQAARTRQGVYAAGSVALAGVVTAGVVTGPSVLGLGSRSSSLVPAGQGSGSTTGSASETPSGPTTVKGQPVTPCPMPSQAVAAWETAIEPHLPAGASITKVAPGRDGSTSDGVGCVRIGGSMSMESLFTLADPDGILQVDVTTGFAEPEATSAAANPSDLSEQQLSKLEALKSAMAAPGVAAGTDKIDPSSLASKEAAKKAMAGSANAAASDDAAKSAMAPTSTCSDVATGEQLCTTSVAKGGYTGLEVDLSRKLPTPLHVDLIASTADTSTAAPAPLDAAQLTAIAEAIAAQY